MKAASRRGARLSYAGLGLGCMIGLVFLAGGRSPHPACRGRYSACGPVLPTPLAREELILPGSVVRLRFAVEVDGRRVDSTLGEEPLEVRQGSGELVRGLDDFLVGLRPGDHGTVVVPPMLGYGARDEGALEELPLANLGALARELAPGDSVHGLRGGEPATGRVLTVGDGRVTLDFNHPLAGKTLTFQVEVL